MSETSFVGSSELGTSLQALLLCQEIQPGSEPSYQMCKTIFLYHPLGQRIAEEPIRRAQFLPRLISVKGGPEDELRDAFAKQWELDECDNYISATATQARVYGIASMSILTRDEKPSTPLDAANLSDAEISYNVLDPLNTAGSLVLNQDPNAMNFQKHRDIAVSGILYHRSRTVTIMNEMPIYIAYSSSAFGFVGRSVYQRALFPLKSFVQTMIADDMVSRKVGLIVASLKMAGSVIDAVMSFASSVKRTLLSIASTNNVISIGEGEEIKSLDLTNLEGPADMAREHIIKNIASAVPMPAVILTHDSFAEGFGEGTNDSNMVADYVDGIRKWMRPLYRFMDMTTQRRAWNERFYQTIKAKYPEQYKDVDYDTAFYEWQNGFEALWPPLVREPESEKVRVADTKLKAVIAAAQVLLPEIDPENQATLIQWLTDQFNGCKELFSSELGLDPDLLLAFLLKRGERAFASPNPDEDGDEEPKPNKPFAAADSVVSSWMQTKPETTDLQRRILSLEDHLRKAGRR